MENGLTPYWTPEDLKRLMALHSSGLTTRQIAESMGVSFERVRDKMQRLRNAERRGSERAILAAKREERKAQIKALAAAGKSMSEVCLALGLPRTTVQSAIESMGIKLAYVPPAPVEPWQRIGISRERWLAGKYPLPPCHPVAWEVLQGARAA